MEKNGLTQRRRCVIPALGVVLVDVELGWLQKTTYNVMQTRVETERIDALSYRFRPAIVVTIET